MASMRVYDPFADTGLDELFRGFFRPARPEPGPQQPAPIRIDVAENETGYIVHAEMPGVRKEDIQVGIEGNQVTIGAEVKRASERKEGERVLRNERYFGSVFRSFTLPFELDEERSEARYDNGVLELRLPKRAQSAGRKLQVS